MNYPTNQLKLVFLQNIDLTRFDLSRENSIAQKRTSTELILLSERHSQAKATANYQSRNRTTVQCFKFKCKKKNKKQNEKKIIVIL